MLYRSISFCLTVEEDQASGVIEDVERLIDSLVVRGVAVFDTDMKSATVCDVEDAQAVRDELMPRAPS